MRTAQQEIDERTKLAGNNKFELLLFQLGEAPGSGQRELFGINVFKVREILVMPPITELGNSHKHLMGVANIRGQIIPVINPFALWLFQGTAGQNQYGPDPRNPDAMAIPSPAAPPTPVRPPKPNQPAYVPPAKLASFRCTSCGAQNKDISYTQSPSCEFCGAPHVRK